jgi:hypothetical protein
MRPFAGLRATGVAFRMARVSTSNGSSISLAAAAAEGRRFCVEDDFVGAVFSDATAAGVESAGTFPAAGFGGAATEGRPVIDAPQNGQFSASSSRTEALQDGQVLNSMNAPFGSLAEQANGSAEI